jgi:hypothetical protein
MTGSLGCITSLSAFCAVRVSDTSARPRESPRRPDFTLRRETARARLSTSVGASTVRPARAVTALTVVRRVCSAQGIS